MQGNLSSDGQGYAVILAFLIRGRTDAAIRLFTYRMALVMDRSSGTPPATRHGPWNRPDGSHYWTHPLGRRVNERIKG